MYVCFPIGENGETGPSVLKRNDEEEETKRKRFESNKAIVAGPWTAIEPISVVRGVDVRVAETVKISSPPRQKQKPKKKRKRCNHLIFCVWYNTTTYGTAAAAQSAAVQEK